MSLLLKGAIVGFLIAAPVGPIGILCIARALGGGWRLGFVSGLGAAVADAFYGAVAAFGISAVTLTLTHWTRPLHVAGAVVLAYLGVRIAFTPLADDTTGDAANLRYRDAFLSTVGLTLVNPATIFSFLAVFATLAPGAKPLEPLGATLLVTGVFLGSAAWWLLLGVGVGRGRHALGPQVRTWIARCSGAALVALGVASLF